MNIAKIYVCMYVCMYCMHLEEGHKECHERAASSKVAGFEAEARIQSSDPPCRIDLTTNLHAHNNLYTFIHQYTHTYIHTQEVIHCTHLKRSQCRCRRRATGQKTFLDYSPYCVPRGVQTCPEYTFERVRIRTLDPCLP